MAVTTRQDRSVRASQSIFCMHLLTSIDASISPLSPHQLAASLLAQPLHELQRARMLMSSLKPRTDLGPTSE